MAKKKKGNGEGSVYKTKSGFRGQIVVALMITANSFAEVLPVKR